MELTKKQTEGILSKYLRKENGLNEVLQMMLNAMMLSEAFKHIFPNSDSYQEEAHFCRKIILWLLSILAFFVITAASVNNAC